MQAITEALRFDPKIFILQLVLFLALLVTMNALFWKPMMAHLAGRDREKADAYRRVDETEREMERLRADYMARITQIESEARAHIQTAIKEAQTERERILMEARAHADATLKQGIADMQAEKIQALQDLRPRLVGIAANAAHSALGSVGDQSALRQSIETRIAQNTPVA